MTQPVYPRIGLFIDGKWEYDHPTGPQVRNPSNEAVLACVPLAGVAELDRALDAAQKGFLVWRGVGAWIPLGPGLPQPRRGLDGSC